MELTLSLVPQNIFTSITVPYNIDDVAELKAVIEEVHGLSPDEYRLVASGRVLEDQMALKNLNHYKNCVVYVIPSPGPFQSLFSHPISQFGYAVRNESVKQIAEEGVDNHAFTSVMKTLSKTASRLKLESDVPLEPFDGTFATNGIQISADQVKKLRSSKEQQVKLVSAYKLHEIIEKIKSKQNSEEIIEILKSDLSLAESLLIGTHDQDAFTFVRNFIQSNIETIIDKVFSNCHIWDLDLSPEFHYQLNCDTNEIEKIGSLGESQIEEGEEEIQLDKKTEEFDQNSEQVTQKLDLLRRYSRYRNDFKLFDKEKDDSCATLEEEILVVNRELEDHFTTKGQLENKKNELAVEKDKYLSEVTQLKEKELSELRRLDQEGRYNEALLKILLSREIRRLREQHRAEISVQQLTRLEIHCEQETQKRSKILADMNLKLEMLEEDSNKKIRSLEALKEGTEKVFSAINRFIEKDKEMCLKAKSATLLDLNEIVRNHYELLYSHDYGRQYQTQELEKKIAKCEKKLSKARKFKWTAEITKCRNKIADINQKLESIRTEKATIFENICNMDSVIERLILNALSNAQGKLDTSDSDLNGRQIENLEVILEGISIKHPKGELHRKFLKEQLEDLEDEELERNSFLEKKKQQKEHLERLLEVEMSRQRDTLKLENHA